MKKSVFGFDTPEESPGFLLWQSTTVWQRKIKKSLDPYEISHAQFVVLAVTKWFEEHKHEVSQSLIIKQSKLDKMTVSKSLKELVLKKFVTRMEHPVDTRSKTVYLTKEGKVLIAKLVPVVEKIDSEFFGEINLANQKILISILNKLAVD